jgi:hydroxymethylglutaryl-CoA synthase
MMMYPITSNVLMKLLKLREAAHLSKGKGYIPQGDISRLRKGTYYLTKIDEKFRREYAIKE